MQSFYDYKKFAILYVDDEEKSLKYFSRAFGDQFRIFTAINAEEGFKLFNEHKDEIAILVTDQRMPGEKGVQLLEKVRQLRPKAIRMLATAYSDIEAAIAAVNTGAIYKYIHKPWDVPQLEMTLKRALEFYMVQMERDQLMSEKLSVLQNIMITDRVISLGVLGAGLDHHVRNPLAAVRAFLDSAPENIRAESMDLEALRNPNYWRELHEQVQTRAHQLLGLLAESTSSPEQGNHSFKDSVRLSEIIAEAISKSKAALDQKGIRIENTVPPSLPELKVDAPKFHRIFDLLIKEQALHVPDINHVKISAEAVLPDRVKVEIAADGTSPTDSNLRSVLNPLLSGKNGPQESGINLLACYLLVYHHGGTIEVRHGQEKRTTLGITLPVNPAAITRFEDEKEFVTKVLSNEALWEKLLSTE